MMKKLEKSEIEAGLNQLSGWDLNENRIEKEYVFKNFTEALRFVNKAGEPAETMNHHPDILIHSWNKVKIMISTHSEGGITAKDFELAKKIDEL